MKIIIVSLLASLTLFANNVIIADNVAYIESPKENKRVAINICNISYLEHKNNTATVYMKNVEIPVTLNLDLEKTKKIISELTQCQN